MSERIPAERAVDKVVQSIQDRHERLSLHLDAKNRRLLAANEALAFGRGGIATVAKITGLAQSTIGCGLQELDGSRPTATDGRVRREGGGAKTVTERQPGLREALLD